MHCFLKLQAASSKINQSINQSAIPRLGRKEKNAEGEENKDFNCDLF